jgi:hypothetical protein
LFLIGKTGNENISICGERHSFFSHRWLITMFCESVSATSAKRQFTENWLEANA